VYIPPTNQILSICQKNLEPSLLIAKIADDPFKVVNSGVRGKVTTTRGVPISGVNISTTYAGEVLWCYTNDTGHYNLKLPPGSYTIIPQKNGYWANSFGTGVIQDSYSRYDFSMEDTVPPVISKVWANISSEVGDTFEINSFIRINVEELNNETELNGSVTISSNSTGYQITNQPLDFDMSNGNYYYLWDTHDLQPALDYIVESRLKDYDHNSDTNGSNDTGPDLILKLVDNTPPIISLVDTFALDSYPPVDTSEKYEVGTIVRIFVEELVGEQWLNGSVTIASKNSNYHSGIQDLKYDDNDNNYFYDWPTKDLEPADDYKVDTTLWDQWGNKDIDGVSADPDIIIELVDTTPPVISKVDSKIENTEDYDEVYEIGSSVIILVEVLEYEDGISGWVNISSESINYKISLNNIRYNATSEQFYVIWDTIDLEVASDYSVEVVLADRYMNYNPNGSKPLGPDLIIRLVDTTAPEIEKVYSFVGVDTDNIYEVGDDIWVVVIERNFETNLTGSIIIESKSIGYTTKGQLLSFNENLSGYIYIWETYGLSPAEDYQIETSLRDRYNNTDEDGLLDKPDLKITLEDTTPPEVAQVWSQVKKDNDNIYETGSTVKIIVEELSSEPYLSGDLMITSQTNNYSSGKLSLIWDDNNDYYFHSWVTYGLIPGDDYWVESTLADKWSNIDSDGLPSKPDITITLVDTTPPTQATNLAVKQDSKDKIEINLYWNTTEVGTKSIIYRTEVPDFNILNATQLAIVTENNYTDNLVPKPGQYYYLVVTMDEYDNINFTITDTNTGTINVSIDDGLTPDKDRSSDEIEDHLFFMILLIVIIIIFVLLAFGIYLRKREKVQEIPKQSGQEITDVESKNRDEYEDWSNISKDKKPYRIKDYEDIEDGEEFGEYSEDDYEGYEEYEENIEDEENEIIDVTDEIQEFHSMDEINKESEDGITWIDSDEDENFKYTVE
jgi:hypothetical protein